MIIKREYVTFGNLMSDSVTADVIRDAIKGSKEYQVTEEDVERILKYVCSEGLIFNQAELGCGIPWDSYQKMLERFKELDITHPFDNGLDYRDVSRVLTFPDEDGNAITQWLIRGKTADWHDEIFQIVAFERIGSETVLIEPVFPGKIVL